MSLNPLKGFESVVRYCKKKCAGDGSFYDYAGITGNIRIFLSSDVPAYIQSG